MTRKFYVLRGGSWYVDPDLLRSSARLGFGPGNRISGVGFRLAIGRAK